MLAVTDIGGSTEAIAAGRHETVNFVAAMAIAAARNLCAPGPIPFLFGCDGTVLMASPRHQPALRQMLARVRGTAWREHSLRLRVGMVPVQALRSQGCDVRLARHEPTPGNSFGVFAGGGISVLEDAIRGRAWPELGSLAEVADMLDDGAALDMSGLSCRWAPLQSKHGKMLTLMIQGADDPGAVFAEVMRLAGHRTATRGRRARRRCARCGRPRTSCSRPAPVAAAAGCRGGRCACWPRRGWRRW